MIRDLWYRLSFRPGPDAMRYVPGKMRRRLYWMRLMGYATVISGLFLVGISVWSQTPAEIAVKLANTVEGKSVTWLLGAAAFAAMIVNVLLVNIVFKMVRELILSFADLKKQLSAIRGAIRNRNNQLEDTPA